MYDVYKKYAIGSLYLEYHQQIYYVYERQCLMGFICILNKSKYDQWLELIKDSFYGTQFVIQSFKYTSRSTCVEAFEDKYVNIIQTSQFILGRRPDWLKIEQK
jgi:hypothetical protein